MRHVKIYYHFFCLELVYTFCVVILLRFCWIFSRIFMTAEMKWMLHTVHLHQFRFNFTRIATCVERQQHKSNLVSPFREEKLEHINNDYRIMYNKRYVSVSISKQMKNIFKNRTRFFLYSLLTSCTWGQVNKYMHHSLNNIINEFSCF